MKRAIGHAKRNKINRKAKTHMFNLVEELKKTSLTPAQQIEVMLLLIHEDVTHIGGELDKIRENNEQIKAELSAQAR